MGEEKDNKGKWFKNTKYDIGTLDDCTWQRSKKSERWYTGEKCEKRKDLNRTDRCI